MLSRQVTTAARIDSYQLRWRNPDQHLRRRDPLIGRKLRAEAQVAGAASAGGETVSAMASIVRIAVPAITIFASGWLLRDPMSVSLWQLGLGLLLASVGVVWIYLQQS